MDWSGEGFVLAVRRHGENDVIVSLLTREHGRHAGLVRGGAGRRARGLYQPGNRLAAVWRARLSEHLGHFTCELAESHAAALLEDPLRLAGLASAVAVAEAALPEREPHRRVYDGFAGLLASLAAGTAWPAAYVRWERDLLADLGFGLDLARCAATGAVAGLVWVSPKTGRAVSAAAGEAWRERLLPLPAFLLAAGPVADDPAADDPAALDPAALLAGLRLTGHFLDRHVFAQRADERGRPGRAPAARDRLVARLKRRAAV